MLKATIPHIGNSYIPFRTLLTELGLEPIIPPLISDRTIALGSRLAPEFACFPFKVNLGNFIEAIELGAEFIIMAGGIGPCRFGYYGEVQREILRENGYNIDFFLLEAPKTHPYDLWKQIKKIFPKHQLPDIVRAIHMAWLKAAALDEFDRAANKIRPTERVAGITDRLQQKFYTSLDQAFLERDIRKIWKTSLAELESYKTPLPTSCLRIMIVGEIYMVLEPRVNFHLEKVLGTMGVAAHRTIYFTDWVREQLCMSIFNPNWRKPLFELAKPYLHSFVGGHGLETVAHTVKAGQESYDGVIQLAPFTCMPEIVAMQVIPTISKDLSIPCLSLIIDEHSAPAGVLTRLEAFVDLLRYKKQKRAGGYHVEVLSGN